MSYFTKLALIAAIATSNSFYAQTTWQLIWIILIFALFNSGLHQLWFVARSLDSGGWNYFIAMFVGDVAGSLICIISIKYGLSWMVKKFSKPPPHPTCIDEAR